MGRGEDAVLADLERRKRELFDAEMAENAERLAACFKSWDRIGVPHDRVAAAYDAMSRIYAAADRWASQWKTPETYVEARDAIGPAFADLVKAMEEMR